MNLRRHKYKKGRMAALILVGLSLMGMPVEAWAATKPISSVNVSVTSKLEAGSRLPDIQIGGGGPSDGGITVKESGSKYSVTAAEWVEKGSDAVQTADEPRMKVTLTPTNVSEYYFLASYKESNVKVSGGSFVSARREGNDLVVTLRVKPVKGEFDPPKDAYWFEDNLGEARWKEADNDSGCYELQLSRDGKNIHKVEKTTSRNYNFYPYMTEAGDYTFKVRTIPKTELEIKHGKKSDWVESGELEITDRYVSDGKGQQSKDSSVVKGTKEAVGWFQEGGRWGYRYPDGNVCSGGWTEVDGLWYYFDDSGAMATGWRTVDGQPYYLHDNGQMALGWNRIGDTWYDFRPEGEDGFKAGSLVASGWRVIGPYYYYFNDDGSLYTGWLKLNGKTYYLNTLDNSLQGAMFTGWIKRDEKTYFADSNGELLEGWNQIDGQWYYFYPETGEMARGTRIDGFPIDEDGVWR